MKNTSTDCSSKSDSVKVDQEIKKRVAELSGDGRVACGDFSTAVYLYEMASAKTKLCELGNRLLLDDHTIELAVRAFTVLDRIPHQQFLELGSQKLTSQQFESAYSLFRACGRKDLLKEVGKSALAAGCLDVAYRAYLEASSEKELTAVGQAALQANNDELAYKCFSESGDRRQLSRLGSWYLERGKLVKGLKIFQEIEEHPPNAKLIACGKVAMKAVDDYTAWQAFMLARSSTLLIILGNELVRRGCHSADHVYKAAARIEMGLDPQDEKDTSR